jgi:AcrR family transcriptional regulator
MASIQTGPAPGRLERRKARTRAAILEAASGLFLQQGFDETSIQQIAERADTGVGTLYGYFASKEVILQAVLGLHVEQAIEQYRAAVDSATPPKQRLKAALDTFATYVRENRAIMLAAFRVAGRNGWGDEEPMEWLIAGYTATIREGIKHGRLVDLPVDSAVRMLLGTYLMALLGVGIWRGRENDPALPDELEVLTERLLEAR